MAGVDFYDDGAVLEVVALALVINDDGAGAEDFVEAEGSSLGLMEKGEREVPLGFWGGGWHGRFRDRINRMGRMSRQGIYPA